MAVIVKSFQQLAGQMLRRLMAVTGINDTVKGSGVLTFLEAVAQNDFEQIAALIQLLDDVDVDHATGIDLDKLAIQYGLLKGRLLATFGTGYVDVSDSTFTKVSTNLYVGANPPLAGDSAIKVNSITGINNGDQIYVGRGTANEEGPITITTVSAGVAFSTINLSTPLTFNHNGNEAVIRAQGGLRSIAKGTKVRIPASNVSEQVTFATQADATIADGESIVQNVLVRADKPGSTGNAGLRLINDFSSAPFSGATVTNNSAFSNATDREEDDDLRARIKSHIQSLARGVAEAIKSGVLGLFDDEDNKRVVSASLIEPVSAGDPATLYIDDGTGFEPSFVGRGSETVIEAAGGTEQFLQLGSFPIVKAQLVSTKAHPYDFSVGGSFVVKVNDVAESIDFSPADFETPDGATAIEVANIINDNATTFEARTAEAQSKVVIFSKGLDDDRLQAIDGDVNDILGFSTDEVLTLRLYKNDELLNHDGATASVESADFDSWAGLTDPSVLALDVNDKPRQWLRVGSTSLEVAYGQGTTAGTYVNITGVTTFLSLGVTIATASVEQWATVLNQIIQGAQFEANQDRLRLVSLMETAADSRIQIVSTATAPTANLAASQGWDTTEHLGRESDYAMNRFSGQIELAEPLVANDKIEAGSANTRAFRLSKAGPFNLLSVSSRLSAIYVVVDGVVTLKNSAITPSVTTVTLSRSGTTITYTANGAIFGTVATPLKIGDYVVIGRSEAALHENIFRITAIDGSAVDAVAAATSFAVVNAAVTGAVAGTPTAMLSVQDVQIFTSSVAPQKVVFTSDASTSLAEAVTQINEQVVGATASSTGTVVKVVSNRYTVGGSIQVPASVEYNASSRMDIPSAIDESVVPHVAALESRSEIGTPVALGKGTVTTSDTDGVAPIVITDSARTSNTPATDNQWVKWLTGNNKNLRLFVQSFDVGSPTVLTMRDSSYTALGAVRLVAPDMLHHTTIGDLYAQFQPFEFNQDDTVSVTVDDNELGATYVVPLYRNGRCTASAAAAITGLDIDGAAASTFAGSFWSTYDFTDYKVWFRAHRVVNPTGTKNAHTIRALKYGPIGNRIRYGIGYPSLQSLAIAATVTPSLATTDIKITLGSGANRAIASAADTQFDITVTATDITYTHDLTGTHPQFVANGVVVGDIATITSTNFLAANRGTGRVTVVTATAITVTIAGGSAELNKTLGVASGLRIYPLASNAASDVITKVNTDSVASLLIEAVKTDADPFGTTNDATGLITLSTKDDTTAAEYVTLVDGENFVSSYSNPGTPSFNLKNNISERIVSDGGTIYDFGTAINKDATTGEKFKLIPVTTRHLADHFNKKGITSLSLAALVQRSEQGDKLQIASLTVGSAGSVHVNGGFGNSVLVKLTQPGAVESTGIRSSIPYAQEYGFASGDTFKAENTTKAVCLNAYNATSQFILSIPGVYSGTVAKIEAQDRASFALSGTTAITVAAVADGTATYTITAGTGDFSGAQAGDEVNIPVTSPFAAANEGIFLVKTATATVLTVHNPAASNEAIGAGPFVAADIVGRIPFFQHPKSPVVSVLMAVDKLSDRFARFRYLSGGAQAPLFSKNGVQQDFWVDVGSPFDAANTGRFRVVAVDDTSFIVENSIAVEQTSVICAAEVVDGNGESTGGSLRFWGPNSAITKGTFTLGALTVPSWWVPGNQGTHAITGQGRTPSTNRHFIYVTRAANMDPQTVSLGTNVTSFFAMEPEPLTTFRVVENACIDPSNLASTKLWLSPSLNSDRFGPFYGTTLTAANKLGFSTTKKEGADGYVYWTGLLRRVHRAVDGYDSDPVTFPGLKAAGARIEVLPPLVQLVKISLNVRTVAGLSVTALSDTIKSTVLSYIGSLGVGEDVILSEVIKRVQDIAGVESVTLIDPTPSTERIAIQDNEKAIAFDDDVTVS